MISCKSKILLVLLFSTSAHAASDLSFSRNARTFETQHGSLIVKSLAFACLGLKEVADGIPCNPAMTPKALKGSLKAEGLLSNGYSNLSKTRRLLNGNTDQSLINDLFSEERVLQAESNVDVMFTSQYLNSRFSPVSYKYFSVIRNDANPDVELFAVEEQDLTIQSGYSFRDFDFGIEISKLDWKFIRQRFKLIALSTAQGLEAIKPKKQTALFIQPAVTYNFPLPWSPRISTKIVNLGNIDEKYDELKHPVEAQIGFGISPPMLYGKLDLLVDYKSLNYEEDSSEKIHFGALYKYGAMNLGFGLDSNGASLGVFYGLEQINAGILFSTTQLPWRKDDYFAQTVYLQVGWQL